MAIVSILACLGQFASTLRAQPTAQDGGATDGMAKLETAGGMAGLKLYDHGAWGLVRSEVTNPTPSTKTPLLLINYAGVPEPQYGSRLWMPPRTHRTVLTPITPFGVLSKEARGTEIRVRVVDDSGASERAQPASPATVLRPAKGKPLRSASFIPPADPAPSDLVVALRKIHDAGTTNYAVSAKIAPTLAGAWASVDTLLMADKPQPMGPAQVQAMRQWLYAGGRLWIMLDKTGPTFPQRLLGDDWDLNVLDRVGLTDLTIRAKPAASSAVATTQGQKNPDRATSLAQRVEADYPFEMVRVIPGDFEVIHTAKGYPASLVKSVGLGQVLVTTLHAQAWLVPGSAKQAKRKFEEQGGGEGLSDAVPPDPRPVAGPALKQLAWMYRPKEEGASAKGANLVVARSAQHGRGQAMGQATAHSQADQAALKPYMTEQVGVNVLGRSVVLIVLALFTLGLLVGGLVLLWRGRLEWIGGLGAALAVGTAAVLVGMGYTHGRKHPTVLAGAALADAPAGSSVARMNGMVSVYRPAGSAGQAQLKAEGLMPVISDKLKSSGGPLRLIFTDHQQWTFENLDLAPQAVHTIRVEGPHTLDRPIRGTLRFTESGLRGRIEAPGFGTLEDPLLVAATGRLAPRIKPSGQLRAQAPKAVLRDKQTIRARVLGQEQIERSNVYVDLLKLDKPRQKSTIPRRLDRPTLLGWSSKLPGLNLSLSESAQARQSSLVRIALKIQAPPPGTPFTVPSPFLARTPYRGSDDASRTFSSSAYDTRTDSWIATSRPQTSIMRFELASAVKAMQLNRVAVRIDLKAPNRSYEVVTVSNGKVQTLAKGRNANGRVKVDLDKGSLPTKRNGSVLLGLKIGAYKGRSQTPGQVPQSIIRDIEPTLSGSMPGE